MVNIRLTDIGLFGNDAAEDEPLDIFRSYVIRRPEAESLLDRNRPLAIVKAYKGEGKSALLRLTDLELADSLEQGELLLAKPATELVPDLSTEDYPSWTRAWKAAIFSALANEIGAQIDHAFSDDAMTLVELAERNGFRSRGFIGSILDRLRGDAEVAGVRVSVPSKASPELTSVAGAVKRRAKKLPAVWILLDDLDKNFENTRLQRTKIASFFDAAREIGRAVPELRIRGAIRPNVWTAIAMEFESLSHVAQYVSEPRWTDVDARELLARRIEGYLDRTDQLEEANKDLPASGAFREQKLIELVFEPEMQWGASTRPAHILIYTLSKHRPRWMIELCKVAAQAAERANHKRIQQGDIIGVLGSFGDRRIQDTVAEFRSQCAQIEELISAFNRQPEQMTTDDLLKVVNNKILQHIPVRISGIAGTPTALNVAAFLFEIGFIFGRRDFPDGSYEHVTYSEKPALLKSRSSVDDGLSWEIHPVFRQSLEMRDQTGKELRRAGTGGRRSGR